MCILPEPETRNGLSLARNDAFATITRSTLPTCSFASTPKLLREPVRSKAPPLGLVSKPKPGEFSTFDPLSAPISGAFMIRPISTPLRVISTLRIKAFNRLHHNKLAKPDVRLSFAPRNALFRFRCGSKLETRFVLPSYRSVNPGTESIMNRRRVLVNLKYDGSATLSSGFLRLIFSELRRCPGGFHVHKSALAESVSRSRSEPWRIRVAEMHQRWWLTVPQRCHGAFMFSMICDPQALAAQLRIKHARWVRTQT